MAGPAGHGALATLPDAAVPAERRLTDLADAPDALARRGRCCRGVLALRFDASPAPDTAALAERAAALLAEQVRASPDGLVGHRSDALGDARRARTLASRAVELARALRNPALEVDALTTLASSWRALGDPQAAVAVARAALLVAGSRGTPSRVARAALEYARSLGPDDARAELLLDALASDPRVPARLREAAARGRGGVRTLLALEEALRVTLG